MAVYFLKFGGISPKKNKEYTTRVSLTTLHIFIFRIFAEFCTAKPPPSILLKLVSTLPNLVKMGLLNFGLPRTGDPPPPVPTLVAAPSGASRHAFSGRHTRPTPSPFSRDNKRTHLTRDHRILVCQFRLLSLILGKRKKRQREGERESARDRERKKDRALASGDRARSAEET